MPYLDVKICSALPAGEFDAVAGRLAIELSDLTTKLLGKKHALTAVAVQRIDPGAWFIGAQALAQSGVSTFFHEVKVTEGTNTKDEKAAYLKAVYGLFERALGPLHPASYAVIHEVRADAWGYGGETQERRYVRANGM
jgi:4-oxalocrotonate tautomerase